MTKGPNNIKLAIQNFREASECLKFDKKTAKFAFEVEGSNYNNPKVDMSTFCERLASGLARLSVIIDEECYEYHMPKEVQSDLFNRLRCCINMLIDDEGVKNVILHGNNEFDGKTLRVCDIVFSSDNFDDLVKIYHTRLTNAFKNLDKFDDVAIKRIKREVIKRFKRECVNRVEEMLTDKSNGKTSAARIKNTISVLRSDFVGILDDGDTHPGTVEMVNDPSLDIDVSKVPLEIVNNFEENENRVVSSFDD